MFQRIRDLREDHDLTQAQMAKILNCSQQVYSNYELGQRDIPTEVLIRLSDFYRVSVDYILGISDDPEQPPALDERSREILSCYLANDEKGRSILYSQNLLLRDLLLRRPEP